MIFRAVVHLTEISVGVERFVYLDMHVLVRSYFFASTEYIDYIIPLFLPLHPSNTLTRQLKQLKPNSSDLQRALPNAALGLSARRFTNI